MSSVVLNKSKIWVTGGNSNNEKSVIVLVFDTRGHNKIFPGFVLCYYYINHKSILMMTKKLRKASKTKVDFKKLASFFFFFWLGNGKHATEQSESNLAFTFESFASKEDQLVLATTN